MKKLAVILSLVLLVGLSASIDAKVQEIPLNEIKEIALRNAKQLWGDVYADESIPLYDQFDNLISYQFNFSLGKPFPQRADLIEDCQREPKALWNVSWAAENYAQVEIGARTDKPVIWGYSKGLSYDYSYYSAMEILVKKHLNKDFQITKMISISFGSRWFVISDGKDEYYIKAMGEPQFLTKEEFQRWAIGLDNIKENQDFSEEWNEYRNGRILNRSNVYIPNHEEMPFYQWIYGCTPCSASMICAWWDCNSVNAANYSLLVDRHWAEWDAVQGPYDYHVPDAVADLADRMDTWGGSGTTMPWNTDDETENFIEDNGYNAWCNSYYFLWDYWSNNDILSDLINEIDSNYPPHVGIWGHSIAGMGYNSADSDFFFHDPNFSTIQHRDISDVWQISKFHLSGSYGVPLEIISPDGGTGWDSNGTGETWNCGNVHQIKWETEVLPYPTVYAKIWYSTLAGTGHPETDWTLITDSTPNDGEYNWDIPLGIDSTECRIRVEAYNNIDESMWGSDGSYGNFTISSGGAINNLSSGNSEMMSLSPVEFFTFMQPEPAWAVIAARKGADNNRCGITLYNSDDFNTPLETSNYSSTINLIVIDRNHLPEDEYGVKAFITDGSDEARIEYEGEDDQLIVGTNPVESFDGGDVAKMYDITLTPGTYTISLDVLSGSANLDFGLYSSQEGVYYGPMGYGVATPLAMNIGSANGDGEDEQIVVTIENTDVYGLCVWSNHYASATFQIDFDSPGEWIGTENTSWDNANNWDSGIIPDRYENVIIPDGTTYTPRITGGVSGETKSLTIAEGASIEVADGSLDVYSTANIYGTLVASDDDTEIDFKGHVRLYENAYLYDTGTANITVYGSWTAEDGAYVNCTDCTIFFAGSETMSLNILSQTHEFNHVQITKDAGYELIFGSASTNDLVINGQLHVASGATFRILTENSVVTKDIVASYGTLEFEMGELVFDGSGLRQARFNPTDVLYAFSIESSCTVSMVTEMHLKGYLSIDGGTLNANGHNISTESGWSNNGGTFNPGGAIVTFNGSGNDQYGNEDGFDELHLDKSGGGDLYISTGNSVTCNSFEWTSGNIRVIGGAFTANDLADIRVMGRYYLDGGTIDLHQGTTSSEYVDLDADIWIYDGTFNIHGGYDYPSEWAYTRAIVLYMEDGILDFKDNGIWLSETGNYFNDVITGGVIRTSGDFKVDRSFTPTGGIVELYDNGTAYLHGNEDCTFHNIKINKGSTTREGSNRNDRTNRVIIDEDTAVTEDVIIYFGGFMQLSSATLTVGDDLQFYGGLNMDAADEIIEVGDDVTLFNGSGATVTDGEFHVNGDWLFYNGIDCEFEAGNTVFFEGDEQSIIRCFSNVASFGNVVINKDSTECVINDYNNNTVKLSGDLNVIAGNTFDVNGNELDVQGAIDISNGSNFYVKAGAEVTTNNLFMEGMCHLNDGNITIFDNCIQDSSANLTITDGNFIIDKPYEGSMESFSGTTILNSGNFQITNNGIQFGAASDFQHIGGTIKIGWSFQASSAGTFQQDSGAIEFIGNLSATINMGADNWFNDIVINKDILSNQVTLMNECVINNDLIITSGEFTSFGHNITVNEDVVIQPNGQLNPDDQLLKVGGDWTNNRGSIGFVEGTGTVRFIGATSSYLMNNENFYNLEVNKSGNEFTYLVINDNITANVSNDVNINSCSMGMFDNSTLNIDHDLIIAEYTNLYASIAAPTSINLKGDFMSHNISGYPWGFGFIPGLSTITFNGSENQVVDCDHIYQEFYNVVVNNTGINPDFDCVILDDEIHVLGDFTVLDGTWKDSDVTVQEFHGNFEVNDGGWWLPLGHIKFKGTSDATYERIGSGISFNSVTIDKEESRDRSSSLILLSDMYFFSGFEGDLIIENGILDLNGMTVSCAGNVTINGGKLALDDNSMLKVGNSRVLTVNNGGVLESIGSTGNEADITCFNAGNFHDVNIESGGQISAEYTIFQYMSSDGVHAKNGSLVDEFHAFNNCTFQNGEAGGSLIQFNNSQYLTITNAHFPENTWGSTYNVSKAFQLGDIIFEQATGNFSGDTFEDDPNDVIDWLGPPEIFVNPTLLVFGDVLVGQRDSIYFYIENIGESTLSGSIATPNGYSVSIMSVRDNFYSGSESQITFKKHSRNTIPFEINEGEFAYYDVFFEPVERQSYNGNIVITHNAGVDEYIALEGNGIGAELTTNPSSFEKTLLSNDTTSDLLTIGNIGNLDLNYNAAIEYLPFTRGILIESGFETSFPPVGWSLESIDGWGNWSQSSENNHSETYSAQASPMIVGDARLITPYFKATSDCILEYWIRAYDPGYFWENAVFEIEVSTDGIYWTSEESFSQDILSDEYVLKDLILGDYSGQNIQVAFRIRDNTSGSGVNIDDVVITGNSGPVYTWLSLDGGTSTSDTISVSSSDVNIDVGFNSSGLVDSTYMANIVIYSNDPVNPTHNIPVTLTVGSAPPDPPINLTIEVTTTDVVLNWDSVSGADSYKVYSSDDPNAITESWTMEQENITGTTWNELIPPDKKFYYVTAVN